MTHLYTTTGEESSLDSIEVCVLGKNEKFPNLYKNETESKLIVMQCDISNLRLSILTAHNSTAKQEMVVQATLLQLTKELEENRVCIKQLKESISLLNKTDKTDIVVVTSVDDMVAGADIGTSFKFSRAHFHEVVTSSKNNLPFSTVQAHLEQYWKPFLSTSETVIALRRRGYVVNKYYGDHKQKSEDFWTVKKIKLCSQ